MLCPVPSVGLEAVTPFLESIYFVFTGRGPNASVMIRVQRDDGALSDAQARSIRSRGAGSGEELGGPTGAALARG